MQTRSVTVFESMMFVNDLILHILNGREFVGNKPSGLPDLLAAFAGDLKKSLQFATVAQIEAWDLQKCVDNNNPIGVDLSIAGAPFTIEVSVVGTDKAEARIRDKDGERIDEIVPLDQVSERLDGRTRRFFRATLVARQLNIGEEVQGW